MKIPFIETTRQAADLERQRKFQEAGILWNKALLVVRCKSNAEYCRHRANFCLSSLFTRMHIDNNIKDNGRSDYDR